MTHWTDSLVENLPLLGHRNWLVIADAAFPWQISPGIETLHTGDEFLSVLNRSLSLVRATVHLRPVFWLAQELDKLPESLAPGVTLARSQIMAALADGEIRKVPHPTIIDELDKAGNMFKILMIKTPLTIPYTSVFMQFDCQYWPESKEREFRELLS